MESVVDWTATLEVVTDPLPEMRVSPLNAPAE